MYTEHVNEFNQRVEEILNEVGGRLIFRIVSRNEIRLVCAEGYISPDPYEGSPSGRVVKHAEGNGHRGLDNHGDPSGRSRRGAGVHHPDVADSAFGAEQRHEQEPHDHGSPDVDAATDQRGCPDLVRVRLHPDAPQEVGGTNPAHDLTYELRNVVCGQPSFDGA